MSTVRKTELHKDLRQSLIADHIITLGQLNEAIQDQKIGETWADALIRKKILSEDTWLTYLQKYGFTTIDPSNSPLDPEMSKEVPEHIAQQHRFVPMYEQGGKLMIATPDPQNIPALDYLDKHVKKPVGVLLCKQQHLEAAWEKLYHQAAEAVIEQFNEALEEFGKEDSLVAEIFENEKEEKEPDNVELEELKSKVSDAPVIRMVNLIIAKSIAQGASDIHMCPQESRLSVRHRIDGILHPMTTIPKKLEKLVISRLKIMAGMDIAEHRTPQDGRFKVKYRGKQIDVRVSLFPTQHGSNMVLRLLHQSSAMVKLAELGFLPSQLKKWDFLLQTSGKILLVTGPTGSGKSTTLYASLNSINDPAINIMTIEDPVEYSLPLIRQAQVNIKAGMTFASGLRSMLRQDPDIIMVGEIRDEETARIAFQAALTGHLVFSTLHTNSAIGAISRLTDMGIEKFLITSALMGVLGQRLVRKICKNCKTKETISGEIQERFKSENLDMVTQAFVGKGCESCHQTGHKGRMVIAELLILTPEVRKLIIDGASEEAILQTAIKEGMTTLRQDGMAKVMAGLTTISEVFRVTPEE